MNHDTPYRFLRGDQRAILSERRHFREREIFMDCLAALHDLVTPGDSISQFGHFSPADVLSIFDRIRNWTAAPLDGWRQNVEINFTIAENLRNCAGMNIQLCTDEYAANVVLEYQRLRMADVTFVNATSSQSSS